MKRLALLLLAALATAPLAVGADVDGSSFRYVRQLDRRGAGAAAFRADGPMFAHSRPDFADVRVLDRNDAQVPWRRPPETGAQRVAARLLNNGRTPTAAVALLDLGPRRVVRDRIELDLPQRTFLGRATVFGGDRRGGTFVRLGTTPVFDVAGAAGRVRSTVAVFPPSDFRYYRVVVTHVPRISGASVSGRPRETEPLPLRATTRRSEQGERTRLVLDLGHANTPVDELRVTARAPRYDRELTVETSNGGARWDHVTGARIVHFPGTRVAAFPVDARGRYLRLTVANGDDEPLAGLAATALARPRVLLVEGGHARPYRVLYGNRAATAPQYDFALVPASALPRANAAALGPERLNPAYAAPADTRSFLERNDWIVTVSLGLAAIALGFVGFLVLRRRT
jgi:hypothetical protein